MQENKPFILNVYRCVHREQVEKYLQPLVDQLLLNVINEEAAGITVRDEDKQFIAQVYSYMFIGLMLDWIKDDMREDPQQIVEKLSKLIKGSVSVALSRFKLWFYHFNGFDKTFYIFWSRDKNFVTGLFLFIVPLMEVGIMKTERKNRRFSLCIIPQELMNHLPIQKSRRM